MYFTAVLTCALVAAVSAQSNTATVSASTAAIPSISLIRFPLNAMNNIGGAAKEAIGLFNSTAQTGTKMFQDGVKGASEAGENMVKTTSSLAVTGLHGGIEAAKKGLDIGTNLAAIVPGFGGLFGIGGNLVKTGLDVGKMAGHMGIRMGSGMASGKLQLASGLSTAGAGLASSAVNMGANMATSGVDTGVRIANSAAGTIGNVVDTAVNYANQASGKLASLASSTADRLFVHASSLPSTLSHQNIVGNIPVSTVANGVTVSNAAAPEGGSNVQVQVVA